jgi:hypothetical protein
VRQLAPVRVQEQIALICFLGGVVMGIVFIVAWVAEMAAAAAVSIEVSNLLNGLFG